MRRNLALLGAMCGLVATLSVLNLSPADAHNPNPYSFYSCGATRDHEEDVVVDSHPVVMGVYSNGVSYLRSTCVSHSQGVSCNWIAESRSNNVHFVFPFGSDQNCT